MKNDVSPDAGFGHHNSGPNLLPSWIKRVQIGSHAVAQQFEMGGQTFSSESAKNSAKFVTYLGESVNESSGSLFAINKQEGFIVASPSALIIFIFQAQN